MLDHWITAVVWLGFSVCSEHLAAGGESAETLCRGDRFQLMEGERDGSLHVKALHPISTGSE